jgi:hypothetical protein
VTGWGGAADKAVPAKTYSLFSSGLSDCGRRLFLSWQEPAETRQPITQPAGGNYMQAFRDKTVHFVSGNANLSPTYRETHFTVQLLPNARTHMHQAVTSYGKIVER